MMIEWDFDYPVEMPLKITLRRHGNVLMVELETIEIPRIITFKMCIAGYILYYAQHNTIIGWFAVN